MKPNRRELLKLIGVGAGAAIAAPVLSRIPDETISMLTTAPEPLDTFKELAEALENDPGVGRTYEHSSNPHLVTKADIGLVSARDLKWFA